jgi:hypothetical protein
MTRIRFSFMVTTLALSFFAAACGAADGREDDGSSEPSLDGPTAEARGQLLGLPICVPVGNPCDTSLLQQLEEQAVNLGVPLCPYDACTNFNCTNQPNGLYPNPADCSTFYKCANGYTYLYDCPSGLLFDEPTLQCEWPELARCAG